MAPGTAILDIDDDESTVDTWTDDKQTDVNIEPDWGSFPNYTDDLSAGIITVRSPVIPAAGAQQVTLAGSIAVTTAAGTRAVQAKKVALDVFSVGGHGRGDPGVRGDRYGRDPLSEAHRLGDERSR